MIDAPRRPRSVRRGVRSIVLVAAMGALALLGLAGCSDDGDEQTELTTGFEEGQGIGPDLDVVLDQPCDGEQTPSPTTGELGPGEFSESEVTIVLESGADETGCFLVADTAAERSRGLMGVTDLGAYDGMLFVFDEPVDGAFHMLDTPTPLSIAWFDTSGALVSTADMEPCVGEQAEADDCPSYPAGGQFSYAVEVPQGQLESVGVDGPGSTLVLDDELLT